MTAGHADYDRVLGSLDGLPDVAHTGSALIRQVPFLGVGSVSTFLVQTFRGEEGDTVFLEYYGDGGPVKLILPPKVSATIARQRDALTTRNRSRSARETMAQRMAAGYKPSLPGRGKKKGTKS